MFRSQFETRVLIPDGQRHTTGRLGVVNPIPIGRFNKSDLKDSASYESFSIFP
jgi:hypothetical protein